MNDQAGRRLFAQSTSGFFVSGFLSVLASCVVGMGFRVAWRVVPSWDGVVRGSVSAGCVARVGCRVSVRGRCRPAVVRVAWCVRHAVEDSVSCSAIAVPWDSGGDVGLAGWFATRRQSRVFATVLGLFAPAGLRGCGFPCMFVSCCSARRPGSHGSGRSAGAVVV